LEKGGSSHEHIRRRKDQGTLRLESWRRVDPPMSRSAGVSKGGITSPGLKRRLKLS